MVNPVIISTSVGMAIGSSNGALKGLSEACRYKLPDRPIIADIINLASEILPVTLLCLFSTHSIFIFPLASTFSYPYLGLLLGYTAGVIVSERIYRIYSPERKRDKEIDKEIRDKLEKLAKKKLAKAH
jgi:hypothetical protein